MVERVQTQLAVGVLLVVERHLDTRELDQRELNDLELVLLQLLRSIGSELSLGLERLDLADGLRRVAGALLVGHQVEPVVGVQRGLVGDALPRQDVRHVVHARHGRGDLVQRGELGRVEQVHQLELLLIQSRLALALGLAHERALLAALLVRDLLLARQHGLLVLAVDALVDVAAHDVLFGAAQRQRGLV